MDLYEKLGNILYIKIDILRTKFYIKDVFL